MNRSALAVSLSFIVSVALNVESAADEPHSCTGLSVSSFSSADDARQSKCLSKDQIEKLPYQQFQTSTFWTDGVHHFEGVALSDVIKHVSGALTSIKLVAENDYEVIVPANALGRDYPIIATRMNGKALDHNDKGPFWVVYPYDDVEEYRTSNAQARSVWMLSSIEVYQ